MSESIEGIEKLAEALAKAQGEFPVIPKDSEVEVKSKEGKLLYKYKYADLTTIISHTRPALSKHGLSFTQGMGVGGFNTLLMHSSGQRMLTGFIPCVIPTNADMKQVAGLITYVKRISLTAALGVSADEDVDAAANEAVQGNTTSRASVTKSTVAPKAPPAPAVINNSAPADKETMETVLNLMIDRGVHENSISNLIVNGYGYKADRPPTWVAHEVIQLLENEDTTDATVERKFKEVLKRKAEKLRGAK